MLDSSNNQEPENPIEDTKSVAKTAKGAVKTARAVKTGIEAAKLTAAAVGTGGTGAAVMLALKLKGLLNKIPIIGPLIKKLGDLGKKIAKGIAALIAYLLLMLGAKLVGLIAGLIFGAITGIPLLFIPVVGPYLYAAWTAYWGYKGFTDPFGTFNTIANTWHAVTHPWELVGKPLGAAKNAFSTAGSNITVGVKGFVSGVGDAIGGTISAIGSTVGNIAGAVFGAIGNAANAFIGVIGGLEIPTSIVTVPLAVGLGTVAGGSILVTAFVAPAAFFSLEGDLGSANIPGQNQYFTLTKTAQPIAFPNLPATGSQQVLFTITLTAKDTRLNNVQVLDTASGGSGGSILITTDSSGNPISPINCPATMNPGEVCTRQITLSIDSRFNDSIVTNTARVIATPEGQSVQTEAVAALVTVGTPSTQCPSTWPTSSGGNGITQGPLGSTSHARLAALGEQAIDIGVTFVPTLATFNGVVLFAGSKGDGYGNYVDIAGTCNGSQFTARWAHLDSIRAGITTGTSITPGQTLGTTGQTGRVSGPHLHYSFWGLPMTTPYIPKNVAFPSCNSNTECNVNW